MIAIRPESEREGVGGVEIVIHRFGGVDIGSDGCSTLRSAFVYGNGICFCQNSVTRPSDSEVNNWYQIVL